MSINRNLISGFILTFVFILSFSAVSADLGMVAGALNFNVSVGGHETLQFRAFNDGGTPLNFNVVPPTYTPIVNQTTPTLVIIPLNGTIAPNSQLIFNVTVYMPWNDKAGDRWDNIAQVVAVANQTGTSGATVLAGVGKEIIILSAPAKTNWALIYGSIAAVVIVVAVGVSYYLLVFRKKKTSRAAAKKAAGRRAKVAARGKAGRARPSARRATSSSRRRKAAPARRARSTARRRRR
jgi:hypothetical protein